jgi:hypothetical protein
MNFTYNRYVYNAEKETRPRYNSIEDFVDEHRKNGRWTELPPNFVIQVVQTRGKQLPEWLQSYLAEYFSGKVKKRRGPRKMANKADRDAMAVRIYKVTLARNQEADANLPKGTKRKIPRSERDEKSAHKRAAKFTIEKLREMEYSAISMKYLLNLVHKKSGKLK